MPKMTIAGHILAYKISYKKGRKTIQLKITSSNTFEITAPYGLAQAYIEQLLQKKSAWLLKQLNKKRALEQNPINQSLAPDSVVLFLGQAKKLRIIPAVQAAGVKLAGNELIVYTNETGIVEQMLKKWYIEQAKRRFGEQTAFWAEKIGVQPTRITLRDQKTRWGSCSAKGSINYNWRVIMAPPEVLDYLVIHELSHMRVPNHSQHFWSLVAKYCPDYAKCRDWLRTNGTLLIRILP